jgi:hypothetical protein
MERIVKPGCTGMAVAWVSPVLSLLFHLINRDYLLK